VEEIIIEDPAAAAVDSIVKEETLIKSFFFFIPKLNTYSVIVAKEFLLNLLQRVNFVQKNISIFNYPSNYFVFGMGLSFSAK
jgi:hypothetical protein